MASYDVIIVGGGSAGCVAAARLAGEFKAKVLLLEAGGSDRDLMVRAPAGLVKLMRPGSRYYRGHQSIPQPQLGGRTVTILQANVLGGGSSVNAMTYTRGSRADYDGWDRELGGAGWSWNDMLPTFIKQEANQRLGAPLHGTRGPLRVSDPHHPISKASRAFLLALQQRGVPFTADFNGGDTRGVGILQSTTYLGERWSASRAWLGDASRPLPNLDLRLHAKTTRVLIEGGKAVGVEFASDAGRGAVETARAGAVLVAAGSFVSPQLLMLSGIGEAAHLESHGIRCMADVPGVGRNLQDHNDVRIGFETTGNYGYSRQDRGWRMLWNGLQYVMARSGPVTSTGSEVTAFINPLVANADAGAGEGAEPTIQFYCLGRLPATSGPAPVGIALVANLIAPKSRGRVSLRSSDPMDLPVVDPAWLTDPHDEKHLVAGAEFLLDVADTPPMKALIRRCLPFEGRPDKEAIARYARSVTGTNWHPVGTCRMGRDDDPGAVVDARLRVLGIKGLHVIDGSVMPRIIGANTNAPIMAIADRAVDFMVASEARTSAPEAVAA